MEPERWRQVEQLYHAVLALDPGERSAYLQEACGAEVVRREVEELLAYEEQSADFLEASALEIAARQEGASDLLGRVRVVFQSALDQSSVQRNQFRLATGAKLGPYEILEPLGAGGMGEIYSARDSRLGRIVALKILTGRMMDQSGNPRRFEREARAISNLNHPNICILYDIGRDNDTDYLVIEYVEGQTLAERLKSGPLAFPELLRIAMEISEALDYAHKCGVIHRDLKPANIMLTGRGAKLVDFGLARWHQEIEEFSTGLPLGSNASLTMSGAMMGTPQYMAPEQIERREADARTDIFALGMVISEMATGQKAFEVATAGDMISAIQSFEPPELVSLRAETPAALQELVHRCLKKSPEERWQSAGDLHRELKRIEQGTSRAAVRPNSKFKRRTAAVAIVVMLVTGTALHMMNRRGVALADQVLYSFTGQNGDGANPTSSVVAAKNGILYGTTYDGGSSKIGTIFELRPPARSGLAWTETVLYSFTTDSDGSHPFGPLAVGGSGALYGTTTTQDGASGHGTVFELTPPATPGGSWTARVLHTFSRQNGDGTSPRPDLAIGENGELYGTTVYGGDAVGDGHGTVFRLTPAAPEGPWMEQALYRFTGKNGDGAYPYGDVVIGEDGTIYGTTFGGNPGNRGTVFKLTPPANGIGAWTETVLYRFAEEGADGASPVAGLVISKNGAIYGTTQWGGLSKNGTVFELKPPEAAGRDWAYSVIHRFTSHIGDGAEPTAGLVIGKDGALYGATIKGGTWARGVVFRLKAAPESWTETVLYSFTGHDGDGASPNCIGHLLLDKSGALYGTTNSGGASNVGTVFKLPL